MPHSGTGCFSDAPFSTSPCTPLPSALPDGVRGKTRRAGKEMNMEDVMEKVIASLVAEGWTEIRTLCGDIIAVKEIGDAKAIVGEDQDQSDNRFFVYLDIEDDETEIEHEKFFVMSWEAEQILDSIRSMVSRFENGTSEQYMHPEELRCTEDGLPVIDDGEDIEIISSDNEHHADFVPYDVSAVAGKLVTRARELGVLEDFKDIYETYPQEEFGTEVIMPFVKKNTAHGLEAVASAFIGRIASLHAEDVIREGYADEKYDTRILDDFFAEKEDIPEHVRLAWEDLKKRRAC